MFGVQDVPYLPPMIGRIGLSLRRLESHSLLNFSLNCFAFLSRKMPIESKMSCVRVARE
jgi:hypothetical protein